jgi:autotransporter-associated beta strand protein
MKPALHAPAILTSRAGSRRKPLTNCWARTFTGLAAATALIADSAQAAAIYYDGGALDWVAASFSTDAANAAPDPVSAPGIGDDITFNISANNAVGNVLSLGGNQSANSLTFSNTLANRIQSSVADQTLTLGASGGVGITINSGAGAVTIGSTTAANRTNIILAASQSWTNNSTSAVTITNGVAGTATTNNTQTLTLGGSGTGAWTFSGDTTAITDGSGGGKLALTLNTGATSSNGGVVLSSANTYSGGTTITQGRISANSLAAFGTGLVTMTAGTGGNGGQAFLGAAGTYLNDFNVAGTGTTENSGYGAIRFTGTQTIGSSSKTFTLAGATTLGSNSSGAVTTIASKITGSGALTLTRATGTTTFVFNNATNDFSGGVNVNASTTLKLGASNVITDGASAGNVALNTGTLDLNGFNETINGFGTGNGTVDNVAGGGTSLLTVGANNTTSSFGGVVKNTTGTVSLTKTGAGVLTLSGASTFTGNATLSQGTITLGSSSVVTTGTLASGPLGIGTVKLGSGANVANLQTNIVTATFGNGRTLSNNISLDGDLTFSSSGAGGAGRIALNPIGYTGSLLNTANAITLTRTNTLTAASTMTVDLIGAIGDGGNAFGLTLGGGGTYNIGSTSAPDSVANTYTGLTTVSAGGVTLNKAAGIDAIAGNLTINGGTLTLGANNENIANTSTVTINSGATFAMSARTETVGGLNVSGGTLSSNSGTMIIAGSGTVAVNSSTGTSTISSSLTLGSGGLTTANTTASNSALTVAGNTTIGNLTFASGTAASTSSGTAFTMTGSITNNSAALQTVGQSMQLTDNVAHNFFAGAGGLTLNGNITTALATGIGQNGAVSFNGPGTTTLGGTNDLRFRNGTSVSIANGSLLDITGTTTIGQGPANTSNVAGGLAVSSAAGSSTLLRVSTGGTLNLIGGNVSGTYAGITFGQNATGGTSTLQVAGGNLLIGTDVGQLNFGNNNTGAVGVLSIDSGTATILAGTSLATDTRSFIALGRDGATGTVNLNGGTLETSRRFVRDGNGSTTNVGAGVANFNFNGGTLKALADQTDWLNSALVNTNQQALTSVTTGATSGNISTIDANGFSVAINNNITGNGGFAIANTGGASTGVVTFGGNSTYLGGTTINAGTLKLTGVGTALGSINGNLAVNTGGTLDLNNTSQGVGALNGTGGTITNVVGTATAKTLTVGNNNATGGSYAGVIANSGNSTGTLGLTKVGTGTQTLTGANTYTGKTIVMGGTLLLSGAGETIKSAGASGLGASNSDVQIAAGSVKLGANEQIVNTATLGLSGGTLNANGFSETLGTLTLSADSTLDFGAGNASVLTFANSSGTGDFTGLLYVLNYSGQVRDSGMTTGISGDSLVFTTAGLTSQQLGQIRFVDPSGFSGTYTAVFDGDQVMAAVPEPGTVFGGLALLGLVGFRERRRLSALLGRVRE